MDTSASALDRVLARLRRRLALRRALGAAVRAGWMAAIVASAALLVGRLAPAAAVPLAAGAALVPLAAGAAAALAWAKRPRPETCAAWIDRACKLEERVATAWGVAAGASCAPLTPFRASLVGDALAALARADLDRATRMAAPRETPLLVAALAALAALFAIPGTPPAGAGPGVVPARAALREAGRRLDAALRRGLPAGMEALEREIRELQQALASGAIGAVEARDRLRALGVRIEAARAERSAGRPAGAAPDAVTQRLGDLLSDVRIAELFAGEAGGGPGGAGSARPAETGQARPAVDAEAFARGFAAPLPALRSRAADADFASGAEPGRETRSGDAAEAPRGGGLPAAELEALRAAVQRLRASPAWPRTRYEAVLERYFTD